MLASTFSSTSWCTGPSGFHTFIVPVHTGKASDMSQHGSVHMKRKCAVFYLLRYHEGGVVSVEVILQGKL